MIVHENDIGGAYVRKIFRFGLDQVMGGTHLSREQVLAIPTNNRQALIDNGYIDVYPPRAPLLVERELMQRFVSSAGFGNFHVFEGRRLTEGAGVSKEEAIAIAEAGIDLADEPDTEDPIGDPPRPPEPPMN